MKPRAWREQQGLTQGELAEKLSALVGEPVPHYRVCRIEAGALPDKPLCRAYHQLTEGQVTAADFYELTGSQPAEVNAA